MLNLFLDAFALAFLIKLFDADEVVAQLALPLAAATAVASTVAAFLFVPHMGAPGYVASGAIVGLGLGCCLHLFVGVEIRKALIVSLLFVLAHALIGILLAATLGGYLPRKLVLPLGPA